MVCVNVISVKLQKGRVYSVMGYHLCVSMCCNMYQCVAMCVNVSQCVSMCRNAGKS